MIQTSNFLNTPVETRREIFCEECEKCFASPLIFSRHQESVHENIIYKCKLCDKIFKSYPAMSRHTKIHSTVKNHNCMKCNKSFSRKDLLQKHIRSCTRSKKETPGKKKEIPGNQEMMGIARSCDMSGNAGKPGKAGKAASTRWLFRRQSGDSVYEVGSNDTTSSGESPQVGRHCLLFEC